MKHSLHGWGAFILVIVLMITVQNCDAYEDDSIKRDRVINGKTKVCWYCERKCKGIRHIRSLYK